MNTLYLSGKMFLPLLLARYILVRNKRPASVRYFWSEIYLVKYLSGKNVSGQKGILLETGGGGGGVIYLWLDICIFGQI